MEALIRWYCRESGVRNLEKHVEKVYRKVALKVASRVEAAAAKLAPKAAKTEEAAAPAAPASPSIVADSTFGSAGDLTKLAEEEPKPAPAPAPAAAEPVKPVDLVTSLGLIPDDLFSADEDWAITEKNLSEYVGKPVFTSDR